MSVRNFKKYANRKFYDEDRGRYVSVEDIARVVKRGGEVSMTCDRTGRDLTLEILARILYEEVRGAGKEAAGKPGASPRCLVPAGLTPAEISRLVRLF
jgi:polyhydroxyalkanoate synthesis regulator protein